MKTLAAFLVVVLVTAGALYLHFGLPPATGQPVTAMGIWIILGSLHWYRCQQERRVREAIQSRVDFSLPQRLISPFTIVQGD